MFYLVSDHFQVRVTDLGRTWLSPARGYGWAPSVDMTLSHEDKSKDSVHMSRQPLRCSMDGRAFPNRATCSGNLANPTVPEPPRYVLTAPCLRDRELWRHLRTQEDLLTLMCCGQILSPSHFWKWSLSPGNASPTFM